MEILLDASVLLNCDFKEARLLPLHMERILEVLERRDVAEHIICSVRIGDTISLVDRQNKLSFRIAIGSHSIGILELHATNTPPYNIGEEVVLIPSSYTICTLLGKKAA